MEKLLEKALSNIEKLSPSQFVERLVAAKLSQIGIALRELNEFSKSEENHD